ncbi:MAG: hypothetical protein QXL24_01665 [Candidatus Jordarchaeaceae archaeon]
MSYSGSTQLYLDGKTIRSSSRSAIGYTDENIEDYLEEVVAYIVFFSNWR